MDLLAADQLGPDQGAVGTEAQQRAVRTDPVRAQRGQVADGLHEVGFADAVGSHQHGDPGLEGEVHLGVAAEIGQRKVF